MLYCKQNYAQVHKVIIATVAFDGLFSVAEVAFQLIQAINFDCVFLRL